MNPYWTRGKSNAPVRMDRLAAASWNALPDETRKAIEARIPEDGHLSILSAMWGGHDFHARLFRGREVIAETRNGYDAREAAETCLDQYDSSPEPDWEEDEEGYVTAPLSYENREGDPALNGAFDKW